MKKWTTLANNIISRRSGGMAIFQLSLPADRHGILSDHEYRNSSRFRYRSSLIMLGIILISIISKAYSQDKFHTHGHSEDNVLLSEGRMEGEVRVGYWRFLYPDGGEKETGHFDYGHKTGCWKAYHSSGSLESIGDYGLGGRMGYWKSYHPNGNLKEEGSYRGGQKQEWWKHYDERGDLIQEGNFVDDRMDGYCKFYNRGVLTREGRLEAGERVGSWKYYAPNGALERILTF